MCIFDDQITKVKKKGTEGPYSLQVRKQLLPCEDTSKG
jgi:hypothetical protein